MRRQTPALAGIVLTALALDGCGEDPGVEKGTLPFQGTNTAPLDPMSGQMKKRMQDKSYLNKSGEGDQPTAGSKAAAASTPAGDSARPAAESKPATESKPAAESKPATETKPATKGG